MHKKIMIGTFVLIILLVPILTLILMPKEKYPFSENENRYLESFPAFSLESVNNRRFMNGFDAWVSDMFVGREQWIMFKNHTERLIGKTEISGVFTYENRMMQVWRDYNEADVERSLAAIEGFAARHGDTPVYFMLAPTAQEIYLDTIPADATVPSQKSFIKACYDRLAGVTGIDALTPLYESRELYLYYRTDHHWTSLGAYIAYAGASDEMSYTAVDYGAFNIEHASSSFRGTLYSKTLDTSVTPDIIDFYSLSAGEAGRTVSIFEASGFVDYDSMYFREYLDKKDKYAAFLGTNSPLIEISTDLDNNDRSLLIFKDSYAHCLIPFLTNHYSKITIADMRYINGDYMQFFDPDEYDQVLFLYNVITFSEDNNLRKLDLAG